MTWLSLPPMFFHSPLTGIPSSCSTSANHVFPSQATATSAPTCNSLLEPWLEKVEIWKSKFFGRFQVSLCFLMNTWEGYGSFTNHTSWFSGVLHRCLYPFRNWFGKLKGDSPILSPPTQFFKRDVFADSPRNSHLTIMSIKLVVP